MAQIPQSEKLESNIKVRNRAQRLGKVLWFSWRGMGHSSGGGAEQFVHKVSSSLVKHGFQVTVFSCRNDGSSSPKNSVLYDHVQMGGFDMFPLYAWWFLLRNRKSFDFIVEDTSKIPLFLPVSTKTVIVHHLNRSKIYFQQLDPFRAALACFLERMMPLLYKFLFKNARFVAVSNYTKNELLSMGLDSDRVSIVTEGVEIPDSGKSIMLHKSPNPTICFVGRLKKYKRPDHAIRAFYEVVTRIPDATLIFVGDGEMRQHLEFLANQLSISEKVQFLGRASDEDKLEVYKKSWINIVTSEKEGWGLVVTEAATFLTPTVAYRNSGLEESVKDKVTGILVKDGDPSALAEAILGILSQPRILWDLAVNSRKYVERATWERTATQMEKIFEI